MTKQSRSAEWLGLFDTGEMDNVCDLVRDEIAGASPGEPCAMRHPLRRILLTQLDAYISEHRPEQSSPWVTRPHVGAAERFRNITANLVDLFEGRTPLAVNAADQWAQRLRLAWLEFIAYGAAHRMYHDLPREWKAQDVYRAEQEAYRAQKVEAAEGFRLNGKELTIERFLAELDAAGCKRLNKALTEQISKRYKVDSRTVQRRQAKAIKDKLLT